ncbi:rod shape-determining protein MreC [Ornithinimicrobium cerasi]|uniref:Cell shape-determining protein MreC n=1 Tax=Ornithinimicrobium cerasi TaxID=2248773 RepID=A0A285VH82_9MICO|nr:rod shape-determining protein MreC [Ornithinimicrobium cerasi]SOC52536.1 rod shape-determining protein MreC [Ornithinimicrobium cerasi]
MPRRRRALPVTAAVLTALTAAALVVDLARPGLVEPLRGSVARVAAPVQSVLAGWDDARLTELTRERNALAAEVTRLEEQLRRQGQLAALDRATTWGDHRLLPARVVAVAPGTSPVGGRTVTLDVGASEEVTQDQTVVSVDGLVGRVVRVGGASSDVLLLGDADAVVGVRFGAEGGLGSVAAVPPPGLPPRGAGDLTLTAVGDTTIRVGDDVTTLGSPDDRPYVARVPLGTVTSVDPDRGQLGATAVVRPHVDPDTLDLVAVVFVEGEGG